MARAQYVQMGFVNLKTGKHRTLGMHCEKRIQLARLTDSLFDSIKELPAFLFGHGSAIGGGKHLFGCRLETVHVRANAL